jgi:3-mercaptopyruvate sulfurtransferase SseA
MSVIRTLTIATFTLGIFVSACSTSGSNTAANNAVVKSSTPAAAPSLPPMDNAARISLEDAKKAFDDGTAIFIDTRSEGTYKQEHIKGSINIPTGSLDSNISKLSKGKKLIAYCS